MLSIGDLAARTKLSVGYLRGLLLPQLGQAVPGRLHGQLIFTDAFLAKLKAQARFFLPYYLPMLEGLRVAQASHGGLCSQVALCHPILRPRGCPSAHACLPDHVRVCSSETRSRQQISLSPWPCCCGPWVWRPTWQLQCLSRPLWRSCEPVEPSRCVTLCLRGPAAAASHSCSCRTAGGK